jgi:hypothetical protein
MRAFCVTQPHTASTSAQTTRPAAFALSQPRARIIENNTSFSRATEYSVQLQLYEVTSPVLLISSNAH